MKLLEISNLHSGYGHLHVLRGVSLEIMAGECVALLGPNGAGKTTLLRTIAGLLQPWSGEIALMGKPIDRLPTHQIIRMGLGFITEKSNLFAGMSVWENLILGSHYMHDGDKSKAIQNIDYVLDLFPVLAERKKQLAGTLSGGERKMLAIGRGLISSPQLILVDEPSLGLAPNLVRMVFEALKRLHQRGVTILIIEQNVGMSLQNADRGYILEQGQIVMKGYSKELLRSVHVKNAYLGIT